MEDKIFPQKIIYNGIEALKKIPKRYTNLSITKNAEINYISEIKNLNGHLITEKNENYFDIDNCSINTDEILEQKFLYLDEDKDELENNKDNFKDKKNTIKYSKNKHLRNKRSKKRHSIKSNRLYLYYKNKNIDKMSIIKVFEENEKIPHLKQYIIASDNIGMHLYIEFGSNLSFNKKINPNNFNYENSIPKISECDKWTEIDALLHLCKDENNYITNIDIKKLDFERNNRLIQLNGINKMVKMGEIILI